MCQLSERTKAIMAIVTSESAERVPCIHHGTCKTCDLEKLVGTKLYDPTTWEQRMRKKGLLAD